MDSSVDAKSQNEPSESKPASETVDLKEVKRVDLILKSLYSKVHSLLGENILA